MARETANRYLIYLYADGTANRSPKQGSVGRPSYLYTLASAETVTATAVR